MLKQKLIRLDEKVIKILEKEAEDKGINFTVLVRMILKEYTNKTK